MIKEIDKLKEPPKLAIKFANVVFVLGILFSTLLTVYATYKIYNPPNLGIGIETVPASPEFYVISMLSGGVFAALFGLGLKRLSNNQKVNLSLLFFTAGITVYGFETYSEFWYDDTKTKMEVLVDLRDSGVGAFLNVQPRFFRKSNGLTAKKGRIYPLGTISNSTKILGNEAGYYPIIETDEHGFNNPKGLYEENKVDIVLIGDSFTAGCCVHSNETISAVLRKLDFNAVSVGMGGNGPLLELAALKEYAETLMPKIVLWFYYVNDLGELEYEMQSSLLRKYLNEDDYSQNLISRQEEIDGVLKNYVQVEWKKNKVKEKTKLMEKKRIINLLKLTNLRIMINLKPIPTSIIHPPTPVFRNILQQSKQMVSEWGGKMYFVYLTEWKRYSTGNEYIHRDFVMQTATELGIPIIDIHREVFDSHLDPLSLFPFRAEGHYNAEGYKLVAEAIGRRLEADGHVPIK